MQISPADFGLPAHDLALIQVRVLAARRNQLRSPYAVYQGGGERHLIWSLSDVGRMVL